MDGNWVGWVVAGAWAPPEPASAVVGGAVVAGVVVPEARFVPGASVVVGGASVVVGAAVVVVVVASVVVVGGRGDGEVDLALRAEGVARNGDAVAGVRHRHVGDPRRRVLPPGVEAGTVYVTDATGPPAGTLTPEDDPVAVLPSGKRTLSCQSPVNETPPVP